MKISLNTPVVSKWLRLVLTILFSLTIVMILNSTYLAGITLAEELSGIIFQNQFYLLMFFSHLALGLLLTIPLILFGVLHFRRARHHLNRYARRAGISLFLTSLIVVVSGILLTRFPFFEINHSQIRQISYWLHVISPVVVIWLFILHRLANPQFQHRKNLVWLSLLIILPVLVVVPQVFIQANQDPAVSTRYTPALTELASTDKLPAETLMLDDYCAECHQDIARQAGASMHKLSSFNNPAYRASVDEARQVFLERDGHVKEARLCAACHDQVPLFSGRFDEADFPAENEHSASEGITCLGCHSISAVKGVRGNGNYVFSPPQHYPFTFSNNRLLKSINHQLIKAKPELHKKTLLKPVHKTAEFCSACHKVHIPESVNHYRWLRGQNHYDSFLQSGVSGHRVDSFYYPAKARENCASCHMLSTPSNDPSAKSGVVKNHGFYAANTAVPKMLEMQETRQDERQKFLRQSAVIDLFSVREGNSIDGKLHAPLRPSLPQLEAGKSYLLEIVVRTNEIGHHLTQGTSDSNELWLEVSATHGEKDLGKSGATRLDGSTDPRAYFLNAYFLDKKGRRITQRNAQDIFVALYDHQIPPGAASVIRYELKIPENISGPITVNAKLNYRKFNTEFYRFAKGDTFQKNDLPITVIDEDQIIFSTDVLNTQNPAQQETLEKPLWQRWNDYGIGLLRNGNKNQKGDLRQAEDAFKQTAIHQPAHGELNLARVHFESGTLDQAAAHLQKAEQAAAFPWTVLWYKANINHQKGELKLAEHQLVSLLNSEFSNARERGFDFSKDIQAVNLLGRIYYELAMQNRRAPEQLSQYLDKAIQTSLTALEIDPENQSVHFNLARSYTRLGDEELARHHQQLHARYKTDDQSIETAVSKHRQNNPAANHAAEPGAIYPLIPVVE